MRRRGPICGSVVRGACWHFSLRQLRACQRFSHPPELRVRAREEDISILNMVTYALQFSLGQLRACQRFSLL